MKRLTASEVARSFSSILDSVADGEEIEVVRNGVPVAVISPPRRRKAFVSAQEFRELLSALPPVDDDFVDDLEQIRRESGLPASPSRS